jgi:hypothetical protein
MRRAARVDENQARKTERRRGVYDLSTPQGRYKARQAGWDVPLERSPGVLWTCAGGCGKSETKSPSRLARPMCAPCRFASYKGDGNPNFRNASARTCQQCGEGFHSYQPTRKYCSLACYRKAPQPAYVPRPLQEGGMRRAPRKDANHAVVVAALEAFGVSVIDTSSMGGGFPDLICGFAGQTILMEIKNPKTAYGRKGLNANQLRWKEDWKGGPYAVVTDVEGALRLVAVLKGQA